MSGQISDKFVYNNIEYELGRIEFPYNFIDWEIFELHPIELNTACWRGFVNTFSVIENKLVLDEIYTNNANNKNYKIPKINNKIPEVIKPDGLVEGYKEYRILNYKKLNYFINYTGSIIIAKDFIGKYYYHQDFKYPTNYEIVIKLTFIDGILNNIKDLSKFSEEIRNNRPIEIRNKPMNPIFFGDEIHRLFIEEKTIDGLKNLYVNCMNCKLNCNNIMKDIPNGIPPRGFYYKNIPVEILIVAKNPGHPLIDESLKFKDKIGMVLFESYRKFQDELYSNISLNEERSTTFHKNLFRYISFFLDIPNNINEIYKYVAHTNLLKCSTYNERQLLRNSKESLNTCYCYFFTYEIDYLQPKLILALGKEVYNFLLRKQDELKIPIIYIKHPSYYYKREEENEKLLIIKNRIQDILKNK
jgi:uracil-DNA glycosylase